MNEHLDSIDDAMIDRLVDGELSADARRRLLTALDGQRDGWRRCALAFIEAQTWRRELRRALVAEASPPLGEADPSKSLDRGVAGLPGPVAGRPWRPAWRESGLWLAVAAMVLIAFGLGRQYRSNDAPVQLASDQLVEAPLVESVEALPSDPNAVTLVVNDRDGASHRVSVPLVDAREMGAAFSDTPHWSSPELDRRLDERGLNLAARRRYVPLYFEQQDKRIPFVVPVDDAIVTPVSRPVY
jgi:anti-sigma factor RsiW